MPGPTAPPHLFEKIISNVPSNRQFILNGNAILLRDYYVRQRLWHASVGEKTQSQCLYRH